MNGGGANSQQAIDRAATLIVAAIARRMSGMFSTPTGVSAGSTASAASGNGGAALSLVATKLLAILAPISAVAAIVGAQTSGLSVFLGALKILGATVGMLLAPVFLMLAAAALTVSDYLQMALLPNLEDIYAALFQLGDKGVDFLEVKLLELAITVIETVTELAALKDDFKSTAETVGKLYDALWDAIEVATGFKNPAKLVQEIAGGGGQPADAKADARARLDEAIQQLKNLFPAVGNAMQNMQQGPGLRGVFNKNLREAIQQMRHENGPQAQQTSLVGASMAAQMAALNMSPYERRMLDMQQKQLDALEQAVNKLGPPVAN